ncbi:unnamed protein product [Lathyrus oleraceus]
MMLQTLLLPHLCFHWTNLEPEPCFSFEETTQQVLQLNVTSLGDLSSQEYGAFWTLFHATFITKCTNLRLMPGITSSCSTVLGCTHVGNAIRE